MLRQKDMYHLTKDMKLEARETKTSREKNYHVIQVKEMREGKKRIHREDQAK